MASRTRVARYCLVSKAPSILQDVRISLHREHVLQATDS